MPAPWARGFQLRIIGKVQGQDCVNVLHFATNTVVNDGPPVDQFLLQLIQALMDCAFQVLLPAVTSDYTLTKVDGRQIHPVKLDPLELASPQPSAGNRGPTSVSFAASLVQIRTGGGGKSGRGRMFLPPPGEADIASSDIDLPTMALILAFVNCVAGKFVGQGATEQARLGVLSTKKVNNALPPFDNRFREATSMIPINNLAVMRSRKKGSGN